MVDAATRVSTQTVRNGSGDAGPGRYYKTPGGRWVWVGTWYWAWDRYGVTPTWATVRTKSEESFAALSEALAVLELPGRVGRYRTDIRQWAVPLTLPLGAEREEVTSALAEQLTDLATLVDLARGEVATPDPEDLMPMSEQDEQ